MAKVINMNNIHRKVKRTRRYKNYVENPDNKIRRITIEDQKEPITPQKARWYITKEKEDIEIWKRFYPKGDDLFRLSFELRKDNGGSSRPYRMTTNKNLEDLNLDIYYNAQENQIYVLSLSFLRCFDADTLDLVYSKKNKILNSTSFILFASHTYAKLADFKNNRIIILSNRSNSVDFLFN